MGEKRNIVMITLDSLRADHCSFMGYHRKTTPTIDKMARNGLYFENAITSSVPTAPSMMGVFTGEYCPLGSDDFTGENWRKELKKRKTLAEVLTNKGYNTIAFNVNPWTSTFFGFNKGFKYFNDIELETDIRDLTMNSKLHSLFVGIRKVFMGRGSTMPWEKFYSEILEGLQDMQPYFLWVFLVDTHTPYFPPKKYRKFCKTNYWKLVYIFWKIQRRNWEVGDEKEIEILKNAYDDEIRYADEFVRRLWEDLKEDDPIFIIHGDHGDGFGEHGFYRHPPMLYEELVHVPLVIYNADIKGKIDDPVSLLGMAPSILELIGEENEFPSKSFLDGGKEFVISRVLEKGKIKVAVRMKNWKFITGQKEEDELYYLKKDPYEQKNVIGEYPDLAKEMRKIVEMHIRHEKEKERIRNKISQSFRDVK